MMKYFFTILGRLVASCRAPSVMGQSGFTIIELLIATLVFSMVLLLITFGVIDFNKAYYQGVIQTNTQNVARTVLENISQAIQFSDANVTQYPPSIGTGGPAPSQGLCIGDQRYSFILGYQLVNGAPSGDQTNYALVRDPLTGCNTSTPPQNLQSGSPLHAGSVELLGEHMRLSNISVMALPHNIYTIKVRVAYGDDDLLCSPSLPGSCTNPNSTSGAIASDASCKGFEGAQFCAVSELVTTVQKRIN